MPRLSHSKSKIRLKRLQERAAAESAAAESDDDMLTPDGDMLDGEMLTPQELAAIVIALDAPEPPAVPIDTVEEIIEFGLVARTFFA